MLEILQYLALISAFLLPWMVGTIIKCVKTGERKKILVCSVVAGVGLGAIVLCVIVAFSISGAQ